MTRENKVTFPGILQYMNGDQLDDKTHSYTSDLVYRQAFFYAYVVTIRRSFSG